MISSYALSKSVYRQESVAFSVVVGKPGLIAVDELSVLMLMSSTQSSLIADMHSMPWFDVVEFNGSASRRLLENGVD
jgi:hypothetical protein